MGTRSGQVDGTLLSLTEFQRMPEEGAVRVELSRGHLVREPRPGAEHGWLTGRLVLLLGAFVEERELGLVATETGFLLSVEPPTVRGPDVAFLASKSIPAAGIPPGLWKKAPELAVEVVSPSNTAAGLQEKVLDYLAAGTELVWVVHPGFRLEVAEIFRR